MSLPGSPSGEGAGPTPGRGHPARRRRTARTRTGRTLRTLLLCAAAGALALAVWCLTLFFVSLNFDGIPKSGPPEPADAGIVLGAMLWDDKPSPGLRERLDEALRLYRQGSIRNVLVSGGLDAGGATITEAEGMRNYLLERGVPSDRIALDTRSRSTYENLKFSRDIMNERGWATAVIVTHQYHGSRAASIARSLGYDPVQVSVTDSQVMNMAYHRSREVLAYTKWLLDRTLRHAG